MVGLQHTLVAFTADHGVAPVPETLRERRLPGGRMTNKELFDPIQQALTTQVRRRQVADGHGRLVAVSELRADRQAAARSRRGPSRRRRGRGDSVPHVARVYTRDQLLRGEVAERSHRQPRRCAASTRSARATSRSSSSRTGCARRTGTTHGTPYNYDAHIPLILMGPRIRPGEYSDHVALNDLAPTLATLVGVEIPAGSSGRVLTEALRSAAPEPVRKTR